MYLINVIKFVSIIEIWILLLFSTFTDFSSPYKRWSLLFQNSFISHRKRRWCILCQLLVSCLKLSRPSDSDNSYILGATILWLSLNLEVGQPTLLYTKSKEMRSYNREQHICGREGKIRGMNPAELLSQPASCSRNSGHNAFGKRKVGTYIEGSVLEQGHERTLDGFFLVPSYIS